MTYTAEKPGPGKIIITVKVPHPELEPFLLKAGNALSRQTEINGFRKGRAPLEAVIQKVGQFRLHEEAAKIYIGENFSKILEEVVNKEYKGKSFDPVRNPGQERGSLDVTSKLASGRVEPVGEPHVAITKLASGEELEFKITLSLLPPLELPDYKAMARQVLAGKKVPEVTGKEVESSLNWLRESRAKLVTVNRGAEPGDKVEIDFSTKVGGVELEGGSSKNHPLIIGQEQMLPGFEQALTSMKAGDEKSFKLDIPFDYRDQYLAGKTLDCQATMKLVQKREVPELNDDFAKSLGNFSSVAEVEKRIGDGLAIEHQAREKERMRIAMLDAIAAETKAEIPDILLERELEKMVAELEENINRMGLKFDNYLRHVKKTAADMKKEWRTDAERRVKIALVLKEIAGQEGIAPSQEEIQETVNRTAERLGLNEERLKTLDPDRNSLPQASAAPLERASGRVDRQAFIDYNRGIARNEKVLQWLETQNS